MLLIQLLIYLRMSLFHCTCWIVFHFMADSKEIPWDKWIYSTIRQTKSYTSKKQITKDKSPNLFFFSPHKHVCTVHTPFDGFHLILALRTKIVSIRSLFATKKRNKFGFVVLKYSSCAVCMFHFSYSLHLILCGLCIKVIRLV